MSVPHERFHRTLSLEFFKTNSYILKWSTSKKTVMRVGELMKHKNDTTIKRVKRLELLSPAP